MLFSSSGHHVVQRQRNTWAKLDMLERCSLHQAGKEMARGIDEGRKISVRQASEYVSSEFNVFDFVL